LGFNKQHPKVEDPLSSDNPIIRVRAGSLQEEVERD